MKKIVFFVLFLVEGILSHAQQASLKIAKLKYGGGGDWYANKTSMPNLIKFCNQNLKMNLFPEEDIIDVGDVNINQYPFIHMTGHGNVLFTEGEVQNLRKYLISGGFLHIDDNYGLNKYIRREMKKVFPELEFVELPFAHPVYQQKYKFANGLPKIHAHDELPPQGFGLIFKGKLICFFSYECDLGNGWEDRGVYPEDSEESRQKALQMGANLVQFAFTNY